MPTAASPDPEPTTVRADTPTSRRAGSEWPRASVLLNAVVVTSWLYACFYATWLARHHGDGSRVMQDFLALPLYLLAGFGAMAGAWQEHSSERELLGWRIIGWAWLFSFVAASLWLLRAIVPAATWLSPPATFFADAYYPLTAAGFILLSSLPRTRLARVRLALDVSIVGAAGATIAWYFVHDTAGRSSAIGAMMGIGDFTPYGAIAILVVASLALHRRADLGGRVAIQVLSLAAFGASVADLIFVRAAVPDHHALRAAGHAVLAFATATFATAGMLRSRIARAGSAPLGEFLPIVSIGTIGGLLIAEVVGAEGRDARTIAGLAAGSMVLTVLILARLTVARYEARSEAAARSAQEARFVSLVQHSAEALLVVGSGGRVTYASPSCARVFGVDAQRLASVPLHYLFAATEQGALRTAVRAPRDGATIRWSVTLDGRRRELETIITDLRDDPAMAGIVLNTRDVSDRIRLEAQLRQTQKLDALGLLAGGIAHDFNNILAAVRANADFLLYTQPEHTEFELEEIRKATDRGSALCAQLLAFSRAEPQRPETLDLPAVVDGIVPMLRRVVPRTITLEVHSSRTGLHARGDRVQLEIALLNLVVNARDAMPDGGTLTITIGSRTVVAGDGWALEGVPAGSYAVITVHDTGIGMDEATRVRVLEPFFTTKAVGEGTGLGLSTVYGIVTGVDGHLRLTSHPGVGTSVTLFFPIVAVDAPAPPLPSPPVPIPGQRGRVLVVDDEDAVRSGIVRFLREHRFTVLAAGDGQEALELLEGSQWEVDVIVSDVTMPRLDGVAFTARTHAMRPDLPVILVTGNPALRESPAALALSGRVSWLFKPFGLDELAQLVTQQMQGAEPVA